jgi:hypothetical protein
MGRWRTGTDDATSNGPQPKEPDIVGQSCTFGISPVFMKSSSAEMAIYILV